MNEHDIIHLIPFKRMREDLQTEANAMAMEPSGVWKNLLSGKQAVPTVACPSCGAQVPEFRIHSHLDTCLTIQEVEPAIAADPANDLIDGEQNLQNRRGRARGQARGRGRPRKRREEAELKNDIDDSKRPRNDDNAAEDNEKADDDDGANFYWEYSVSSFAKLKQENHLSDLQKQALSACGVLQIEGLSAMVVELDRLLADNEDGYQMPALNQRMDTQGHQCEALEAWWEQWATEEWPQGPLPPGFQTSLPTEKIESAPQETTSVPKNPNASIVIEEKPTREATEVGLKISNDVMSSKAQFIQSKLSGHSMNQHAAPERTDVEGKSTELLTKSDRSEAAGRQISNDVMSTKAEQFIQTNPSAYSNAEHSGPSSSSKAPSITPGASAETSGTKAGPSSPSKAPCSIPGASSAVAEVSATEAGPSSPSKASGASPGLQACPICNMSFPSKSSNSDINKHIDECLNDMAGLLD